MDNLSIREREKLVKEEAIISAAEKTFYMKGFDAASMDEIARAAQFTKRTLYQYFENKEDLYFAVVQKGFKRLFSQLKDAYEQEQTGYMRIQRSSKYFFQFYRENPELFRILNYLGYVKKKSKESKKRNEFMQFNNGIFQTVAKMIVDGKADGSIHADLDAEKTAFSLIFLMTGFINQLSVTGDSFAENFSLNLEDFSNSTIDLILGTLKSKDYQSK